MDRNTLTALAFMVTVGCGTNGASSPESSAGSVTGSSGGGLTEGDSGSGGTGGTATVDDGGSSTDDDGTDTGDGGNESGWYPGIPYPTDALPAGIMPTLPTPGGQPGWPYDPIEIALPDPTGAGNEYVIATDGDDGAAGNGGNGTMDAPRRTIPLGSLGDAAKVFIIGDGSAYGTVDFNIGEDGTWQCTGSVDDPCFIVGIDTPRIGRRVAVEQSTHVVIDGLSFVDTGEGRPWGAMNVLDSSYITVRNVEIRGDGSNSSGGSAMAINGVEFLFSYRMTFHEIGSWETNATGLDVHAWRPNYSNRYLWLIDSELFHIQADGVQTGNSNNQGPQQNSSHYVYIAGNEFYENYENAMDNKNSYHVVMSSNDVHDFYATEGMGANGTAIIVSNNSEGPWTGYHWAIDNRVWNTSLAFRDSGSEDGERNFMVGNVVWNAPTAFLQANNSTDRECWVVNNTAYGATTAFDIGQPGNNASVFLHGNIMHGGSLDTASQAHSELRDNILFGTQLEGAWDVEQGNLSEDPMLSNPEQGDMALVAGSPAIDAMGEPSPAYEIFEDLYGLDIRVDLEGTARPSGAAWDMGAVESR